MAPSGRGKAAAAAAAPRGGGGGRRCGAAEAPGGAVSAPVPTRASLPWAPLTLRSPRRNDLLSSGFWAASAGACGGTGRENGLLPFFPRRV